MGCQVSHDEFPIYVSKSEALRVDGVGNAAAFPSKLEQNLGQFG